MRPGGYLIRDTTCVCTCACGGPGLLEQRATGVDLIRCHQETDVSRVLHTCIDSNQPWRGVAWSLGRWNLPSVAPQAKTHCGECRGRNVVCCRPSMIHSHVTDASRRLGTYYYLPCYSLSSFSSSHPIIARVATQVGLVARCPAEREPRQTASWYGV